MTQVILPNTNQTGSNEWSDVEGNDVALQSVVNGQLADDNIKAGANIQGSKLADGTTPLAKLAVRVPQFYTPKFINTEELRENAAFGLLATADEIKSVAVGENGLIRVFYSAMVKSSVLSAGRIALFIGANQYKIHEGGTAPSTQQAQTISTNFTHIVTGLGAANPQNPGIVNNGETGYTGDVTTGQGITPITIFGLAAGSYNISVQFAATSGNVVAKNRKLWVEAV